MMTCGSSCLMDVTSQIERVITEYKDLRSYDVVHVAIRRGVRAKYV